MTIQLNGKAYELEKACSVTDLLDELGFTGKPVVVELNKEAVLAKDFDTSRIEENATIEIVAITAGG